MWRDISFQSDCFKCSSSSLLRYNPDKLVDNNLRSPPRAYFARSPIQLNLFPTCCGLLAGRSLLAPLCPLVCVWFLVDTLWNRWSSYSNDRAKVLISIYNSALIVECCATPQKITVVSFDDKEMAIFDQSSYWRFQNQSDDDATWAALFVAWLWYLSNSFSGLHWSASCHSCLAAKKEKN